MPSRDMTLRDVLLGDMILRWHIIANVLSHDMLFFLKDGYIADTAVAVQ